MSWCIHAIRFILFPTHIEVYVAVTEIKREPSLDILRLLFFFVYLHSIGEVM